VTLACLRADTYRMRSPTWRVAGLLLGSGLCALVYQVSWLRDFRLIFGASTAASAAVLAIFIGGLGLGGLLLGPRADRHPRPLQLYAQLEIIIALSAALTPLLLTLVQTIYIASGGAARLGTTSATIARLVLSTLVLAIPTVAMGGTLPAAARAVTRDGDVRRHAVATLYALNTFGAVIGCLVATFWLLEVFGTRSTLWLAAALNVLVAIVARQVDRSLGPSPVEQSATSAAAHVSTEASEPFRTQELEHLSSQEPKQLSTQALQHLSTQEPKHLSTREPKNPSTSASVPFILTAAAVVGFAFFLMELVWYRLLAPLLGGSVFTFGLVLALALIGIGIGGLLYALIAGDEPATLSGFALSCLVEAAVVAGTFALGDRVALLALVMLPLRAVGFAAQVASWTIIAGIVVVPPALVAGYQFPMLIALFGRGRERIGRQVGLTYAANTIGAIVGALAGGFGLLPWLSATGAWRLVAAVLLLLGAAAALIAVKDRARHSAGSLRRAVLQPAVAFQVGLALATVALIAATGPTAIWRHSGIGAGRTAGDVLATPNRLVAWTNVRQRGVVWEADGTESGVALVHDPTGYAFIVNGKSDGAARGDAGTQVMLGLVGALTTPNPRRALVIGLGTGSSAGWLAAVPGIERVDVVELEPLILDVARASQPVNHDVMNNPKIHVTIGDAREALLTSSVRYDLIASEPSNPFRAGIASLFTLDYYRAAADRLTDDGVFVQWMQGYEIDGRTLQTVYATMAAVFPQIDTWQTQRSDRSGGTVTAPVRSQRGSQKNRSSRRSPTAGAPST
jgi:spermidine synthase